jgi:hypothetical protein
VRQIARRHGGDAHYQRDARDASCFVVSLPAPPPVTPRRYGR